MSISALLLQIVLLTAAPPESMRVGVAQVGSTFNIEENLEKHVDYISQCAERGARVVVFPECALTGYSSQAGVYDHLSSAEIDRAEQRICRATREHDVYAVVGSILRIGEETFNIAFVADPDGKIIERYAKVQLAGEKWATPGRWLSLFEIDGITCSIIICHDERYPELVRLPALHGARVIFYISDESSVRMESKLAPYRAQIVARAVENAVFIVHANAPANPENFRGSHGQSRVILPDGNLIEEASIFSEEIIIADLNLKAGGGVRAKNSFRSDLLRDWWKEGMKIMEGSVGGLLKLADEADKTN
ncbi:carbon-nitrogen hydrolase family protein [candidate division KSB1 bacterium]